MYISLCAGTRKHVNNSEGSRALMLSALMESGTAATAAPAEGPHTTENLCFILASKDFLEATCRPISYTNLNTGILHTRAVAEHPALL